ncbi:hypothetical protein HYH03_003870 [Edaphochlamys debaryana]|uniref:YchJ-like middle NTF2-like domain-containing protein n=1 Tax=Edaphochlamys debaryana TaxID=47281 RepID=A0A835YAW6_9CHLO|nr:hypothetical protein HYH03_003870 [Edaphochlamys debaryana]|eukprot:KAG2498112.1 hypothetical protein HYH03_003870 [Edaphochlamys debaryana]
MLARQAPSGLRLASNRSLASRQRVVLVAAAGFGGFGGAAKQSKACPCGSGADYQACCQRYHKSLTIQAPSAEAVLRARFSAYAKKEWKYVVRTTHPDNTNQRGSVSEDGKVRTTFEEDVKVTMYNNEFVALRVLGVKPGPADNENVVEFEIDIRQKLDDKAKKLDKPIPRTIRESALFVRNGDGVWEFLRALDSNWDRDKLEYKEKGHAVAA